MRAERCWRCSWADKRKRKTGEEVFGRSERVHAGGRSERRCMTVVYEESADGKAER